MIGDSQIDYRFFIGFKLIATDEEVNLKSLKKSFLSGLQEFVYGVNHHLMGILFPYLMKKFVDIPSLKN